jgi:hypothetical protein
MSNCDAALQKDREEFHSNIVYFLSYFKNITQSTSDTDKQNAKFVYRGVQLDYDGAREISSFLSQEERYDVTYEQSVSVLRTFLSDNDLAAYKACLGRHDPVTLLYTNEAFTQDEFTVHVEWNPDFRGTETGVLQLDLTNATGRIDATSAGSRTVKTKVKRTDVTPFLVKRDGDKAVTIDASVEGKSSDTLYIPAKPQFAFDIRAKYDPPIGHAPYSLDRGAGRGASLFMIPAAIRNTDGKSRLLPKTAHWVETAVSGTQPNRAIFCNTPVDANFAPIAGANTEFSCSGSMGGSVWDDIAQYTLRVVGRYTALEIFSAPIQKGT